MGVFGLGAYHRRTEAVNHGVDFKRIANKAVNDIVVTDGHIANRMQKSSAQEDLFERLRHLNEQSILWVYLKTVLTGIRQRLGESLDIHHIISVIDTEYETNKASFDETNEMIRKEESQASGAIISPGNDEGGAKQPQDADGDGDSVGGGGGEVEVGGADGDADANVRDGDGGEAEAGGADGDADANVRDGDGGEAEAGGLDVHNEDGEESREAADGIADEQAQEETHDSESNSSKKREYNKEETQRIINHLNKPGNMIQDRLKPRRL